MPFIVHLECSRCGQRVSAERPQTLCPVDAGTLYARYDMDALRQSARREGPAELAARSPASLGMWRYAPLLPDVSPVTLGEGWTPMLRSRRFEGVFIKDEGANPTGTFEARGVSMAISMARHYGSRHVAMATAGDAVGTLAAYAAASGLAAHLFRPRDEPMAEYGQSIMHGANVLSVDGSVADGARQLAQRIKQQTSEGKAAEEIWFDVSTSTNPFHIEGMKTLGYELVEQLGWQYPDAVVFPSSAVAWIAVSKAFDEMEQLGWVTGGRPRLYTLPSDDNDSSVLDVVRSSGGRVLAFAGEEMLSSLLDWAKHEGIFLSPGGALAAAAYKELLSSGEVRRDERVVLVNPAAGWKYAERIAAAMHLRRPGSLPRSMPVGGIITPV